LARRLRTGAPSVKYVFANSFGVSLGHLASTRVPRAEEQNASLPN
jgi:hypothetical protein